MRALSLGAGGEMADGTERLEPWQVIGEAMEPVPHRWAYPSTVPQGPDDAPSVLTDAQVREWRETGACIVDGLWPAELVARVKAEAEATFRGDTAADGGRRGLSSNLMSFPAQQASLNEMSLHPRLLTAMSQLLRVPRTELRLAQSELWEKDERNRSANYDQRIHMVGTPPKPLHPSRS